MTFGQLIWYHYNCKEHYILKTRERFYYDKH
ncbi:hypothetical protein BSTP3_064 [Bacillus phage BSTP3]|nr:hypothetical protein BSTP3_064 [Bacillus phage BSTP3]